MISHQVLFQNELAELRGGHEGAGDVGLVAVRQERRLRLVHRLGLPERPPEEHIWRNSTRTMGYRIIRGGGLRCGRAGQQATIRT